MVLTFSCFPISCYNIILLLIQLKYLSPMKSIFQVSTAIGSYMNTCSGVRYQAQADAIIPQLGPFSEVPRPELPIAENSVTN